jgi:integrase/recombinase XerD
MKTLAELQQEYIDHITKTRRSKANATFTMGVFAEYIRETGLDYLRFKVKQAQEFQSWLVTCTEDGKIKYAKQTVSHAVTTMRGFYSFLKEKGLVPANPFLEVKKVKTGKRLPKDLLTEDEMQTLLNHFSHFWQGETLIEKRQRYKAHVLCELLYSTGMTIGEAKRLVPRDIDCDKKVIHVTGTNRDRECLLNDYTVSVLKYFLKSRESIYVGPNYTGGQANLDLLFASKWELSKTVNAELKKACKALKLKKITTQAMRHAVGFHLLRGGCDIRYIQEILGHRELRDTQKYLKVEKKDLKAVLDAYHPRTMRKQDETL